MSGSSAPNSVATLGPGLSWRAAGLDDIFQESAVRHVGRTGSLRKCSRLTLQDELPSLREAVIKDHVRSRQRRRCGRADETRRLEFDFKLADIGDSGIRAVERSIGGGGSRPSEEANAKECRRRDPRERGFAERHARFAFTSSHVRAPKRRRRFGASSRTLHYCARHGERSLQLLQCGCCPGGRFVGVAEIAGVRNFQCVRLRGPNEAEGVAADLHVSDGLGDLAACGRRCTALPGTARPHDACALDASRHAARSGYWGRGTSRQSALPGSRTIAWLSVPCGSWQPKQVTPRAYMRLCDEIVSLHSVFVRGPVGECVNLVSPSLCSSNCQ